MSQRLSIQFFGLALACSAAISIGRRILSSTIQPQISQAAHSHRDLEADDDGVNAAKEPMRELAAQLMALKLAAAFGPSGRSPALQVGHPARYRSNHRRAASSMSEELMKHSHETSTLQEEVIELRRQVEDLTAKLNAVGQQVVGACDPELDGKAPEAGDREIEGYRYFGEQMDMLEDSLRTESFMKAIKGNPKAFEGKVVLDVGTGSGVLAIFAAQAGASMVYAVEATDMAQQAKRIVEANGLSDKVRVIQGTIETVELPEKVDIIISEWMGNVLLRESMLDSVLFARDRWLKESGALFPSHATLYIAPITKCRSMHRSLDDFEHEEEEHWPSFEQEMRDFYGINFACIKDDFLKEKRRSCLQSGKIVDMVSRNLLGIAQPFFEIDLKTVTLDSLNRSMEPCKCTLEVRKDGELEGFLLYFDVDFKGSEGIPLDNVHRLTTEPAKRTDDLQTHWGQHAFPFNPELEVEKGDTIECSILIGRQSSNPRLLRLETEFTHLRQNTVQGTPIKQTYYVD